MTESENPSGAPRRNFIKSTAGAAAAAGVLAPNVTLRAQDDKKLKIGLIGMGGRGTGAAADAMQADDNCELWAVGDIYAEKIDRQLEVLQKNSGSDAAKINVGNRKFVGLDAYKQVIDSGVDVVLLTTPPGFRPQHFEAAIEAGKHAFVEKPCATDVAGVKRFMAAGQKAKDQGLSVLCGFCYRYSDHGRELFQDRIHNGDIGDIHSIHASYYTGMVKPMPPESDRPAGMSDVEWQVKNWYNFTWLGGDGIVEQGIHSVDKIFWIMQDAMPVGCYCQGGRQRPNHESNTYDHFHAFYEFEGGIRAHVNWSQYAGTVYKDNKDYIIGSKGQATFSINSAEVTGDKAWKWRKPRSGAKSMYKLEHDEFFANIRKDGARHSDEEWVARSTLHGITARMSAYTGKYLTYDDVLNSGESLVPGDDLDWNGELPVREMAIPGITPYPPGVNEAEVA